MTKITIKIFHIFLFYLLLVLNIFSATCPTLNCPEAQDTPLAIYRFENNLLDSSGNNIHATTIGGRPVTYNLNIGGRPGYSLSNYQPDYGTEILIPSCVIDRNQGEIEWYQYITATVTNFSNMNFRWCSKQDCSVGFITVYTENLTFFPYSIRLAYSYLNNSVIETEEINSECLILNQWQHIKIQWGEFGFRLIVDGIVKAGSYNKWYYTKPGEDYIAFFKTQGFSTPNDYFYGYVDDLIFWPCSSHGTPTVTPSLTVTKTFTITNTFTITKTPTITSTHSITPTFTETFTYTLTNTDTATYTITQTHTVTFTFTPSLTPTYTTTPYPFSEDFFIKGIYPSPIYTKYGNLILVSKYYYKVSCLIYTVSGELVNSFDFDVYPGYNTKKIYMVNKNNKDIS